MANYKSFVFSSTNDSKPLVVPSVGRHHLYLNPSGQIEVINHSGELVLQSFNSASASTTSASPIYMNGAVVVDPVNGNDTTGVVGRLDKPFRTIMGGATNNGTYAGVPTTMYIASGTYDECVVDIRTTPLHVVGYGVTIANSSTNNTFDTKNWNLTGSFTFLSLQNDILVAGFQDCTLRGSFLISGNSSSFSSFFSAVDAQGVNAFNDGVGPCARVEGTSTIEGNFTKSDNTSFCIDNHDTLTFTGRIVGQFYLQFSSVVIFGAGTRLVTNGVTKCVDGAGTMNCLSVFSNSDPTVDVTVSGTTSFNQSWVV